MNRLLRTRLHAPVLAACLLGPLPVAVQANSFLIAQEYLGALIGGPTGGYNQTLSPAYSPTILVASDAVQSTAGSPFNTAWASLSAQASGSSSVGFGLMGAYSSTSASGYGAYVAGANGERAGYAFDVITVHGSGPITVTLHTELTGSLGIDDPQSGGVTVRSSTYLGPAGFVDDSKQIYLSDVQTGNSQFDNVQTGSITVADGQSFYVIATMTRNNNLQLQSGADINASRIVHATTQSLYGDWITLSAGATLSSDSGWNYTAPAAVPEPSTAVLGILGCMAMLARRRRLPTNKDAKPGHT